MIPYTERDAELNLRPPFHMGDVEAWLSVRKIDWGAAQRWVDETLNLRPDGVAAEPRFLAAPLAFVTFMRIGAMRSLDPLHEGWGAMDEREMHVIVPVIEDRAGALPDLFDPLFYPILLCLDSSPAMIAGREAFGFPKIGGRLVFEDGLLEARCEVWKGEGHATSSRDEVLVGLRRRAEEPRRAAAGSGPGGALVELIEEEFGRVGDRIEAHFEAFWEEIWRSSLLGQVRRKFAAALERLAGPQDFVFLKQFRDHHRAESANWRGVVRSPVEFSNLRSLDREDGDWELEVPRYRSSDLLARIGLESGPIAAPIRARYDFSLLLGTTVWSSDSA